MPASQQPQDRQREITLCQALAENQRRLAHNKKGGTQLPYLKPRRQDRK